MNSIKSSNFFLFCFLLLNGLIFSCTKKQSVEKSNNLKSLEHTVFDTIVLKVPPKVNYDFSLSRVVSENHKNLFIGLNDNKLHLFNLDSQKYESSISFPKEGPNYKGSVKDFYFINSDSIIGLYPRNNTIQLIDSEGNIVDEHIIQNPGFDYVGIESFAPAKRSNNIQFDSIRKVIYLTTFPGMNYYNSAKAYDVPTKIAYSLEERKVIDFFGFFPDLLKDEELFHTNDHIFNFKLLRVHKDSLLGLFSFNRDDQIYQYNLNDSEESVSVSSNYQSKLMPNNYNLVPRGSDLFTVLTEAYLREPRYLYTIFDGNNNLYRLVKGESDYQINTKSYASLAKTDFSIIKYDGIDKPIGELIFEDSNYDMLNVYNYKDNLILLKYINRNNENIIFHVSEID